MAKPGKSEAEAEPKAEANEKKSPKEEFQRLIRVKDTDINGDLSILIGLTKIKGIGFSISNAVCGKMGIDKKMKIGDLSDPEITKIEDAIADLNKIGIPAWMLNRRKDYDTGADRHLTTSDLIFQRKEDIERMGEIKSYKGLRHPKGLKVRGQRTASTGRGKSVLGVQRRKGAKAGK